MMTLNFSTFIDASRRTVWETMLRPETYEIWTAAFVEGSRYEGSWEQGERIRFLSPDGNGVTSVIAENRKHEFISIRHVGQIKHGVEDTESEEVRAWAPAFENYRFSDEGGSTRLDVDIDITPEYEDYMRKTWPAALARLKALCESRTGGQTKGDRQ
jgi:uncharacterized protein YndB with AHSA1/START domain